MLQKVEQKNFLSVTHLFGKGYFKSKNVNRLLAKSALKYLTILIFDVNIICGAERRRSVFWILVWHKIKSFNYLFIFHLTEGTPGPLTAGALTPSRLATHCIVNDGLLWTYSSYFYFSHSCIKPLWS